MRKKIIVSGCSFTEKNFKSFSSPELDCSWTKWPELLGEKFNMDVINLGFSGAGNRYILQTLIETIERTPKNEIGLVIAAWSQSNRDDYQKYANINKKFYNEKYLKNFEWKNKRVERLGDVFYWVRETCLFYITLQNICKRYNLNFFQFQMISLFDGWINGLSKTDFEVVNNLNNPNFEKRYKYKGDRIKDWNTLAKLMLEYEQFIDLNHFIGWPTLYLLNGFTIEEKTLMKRVLHSYKNKEGRNVQSFSQKNLREFLVSKYDYHPNKRGHERISEFLYERMEPRISTQ